MISDRAGRSGCRFRVTQEGAQPTVPWLVSKHTRQAAYQAGNSELGGSGAVLRDSIRSMQTVSGRNGRERTRLLAMVTNAPVDRLARKRLGAFYSPLSMVEPMVAWAIRGADQSVLDPSCGDGGFLKAAARRLRGLGASRELAASLIHAVDLNPDAARATREGLASELGLPFANVQVASFFSVPPCQIFGHREGVDVVIGNPPYIRYQEFAGETRHEAREKAADAGVHLTGLASSWAHFVARAVELLRPGGRLALILPAELIHTLYAAPIREHLRRSFQETHIVSFRQAVFPEAQVEVVLLLADGRQRGPGRLRLTEVESDASLADLTSVLDDAEVFEPGEQPEKWIPGYSAQPTSYLDHLQARGLLDPLGDVGKANIGFVSGATEYFVLTPEEATRWRLPESSLQLAVTRARQVLGLEIRRTDIQQVRARGDRCLLWIPGERLTRAEKAYIEMGERLGYSERFKCRVRSPWFRVPGVMCPDAFLTYMSNLLPRLCLNRARVASTNTIHSVWLSAMPTALRKAFAVAFYNSATLLSCERVGRSYGGGVLKLEPREADRVLTPSAGLVARYKNSLLKLAATVDSALRNGREDCLDQAVAAVDAILFQGERIARDKMAAAREFLRDRRRARARSSRALKKSLVAPV
jgi:adenine-specific DNA-methyltransferase